MRSIERVLPSHGQTTKIWEEKEMKEIRRTVPATLDEGGSAGDAIERCGAYTRPGRMFETPC